MSKVARRRRKRNPTRVMVETIALASLATVAGIAYGIHAGRRGSSVGHGILMGVVVGAGTAITLGAAATVVELIVDVDEALG